MDPTIQPVVRIEHIEVRPPIGPPIVLTVVSIIKQAGQEALRPIAELFNPSTPTNSSVAAVNNVRQVGVMPPVGTPGTTFIIPTARHNSTPSGANSPGHTSHARSSSSHDTDTAVVAKSKPAETRMDGQETPESVQQPAQEPKSTDRQQPFKGLDDVARQIIKMLIPEKLNFVFPGIPFKGDPQVQQKEKTHSEENQQKAPASKAQTVAKGESPTTQKAAIPESIDPAAKIGPEMFHNRAEVLPQGTTRSPSTEPMVPPNGSNGVVENGKETVALPRADNTSQPYSGQPLNKEKAILETLINPKKQPEELAQATVAHAKNAENQPRAATPNAPQVIPQPQVTPQQPMNQTTPPIPYATTLPHDPSKDGQKGHQHMEKVARAQGAEQVRPRRDAMLPIEKRENVQANPINQRVDDDKNIPRIPILPDLPFSREGILKDIRKGQGINLKEDEGVRLADLVLMLLSAVICGARRVDEVYRYLHARAPFFKTWLGIKKELPSYRLLSIIMNRLDPEVMEQLLKDVLDDPQSPLKDVRVWESDRGIILGELKADILESTQEALTASLVLFDMEGAILTVDTPTMTGALARAIKRKGGNYLFAIKGCHGNLYDQAQEFFGATIYEKSVPTDTSCEHVKESNREELHEVLVVEETAWAPAYEGLKTSVQLKSEIFVESRHLEEKRYYISSLPLDAQTIVKTLRAHSTFEGRVDWYVDIDFSVNTVDKYVDNFEILRLTGWRLLNAESTYKGTPDSKRSKARVDNAYLRQVLAIL